MTAQILRNVSECNLTEGFLNV